MGARNMGGLAGAPLLTARHPVDGFGNRNGQRVLVEGDPRLLNQYGIVLVNPEKHPNVRAGLGRQFVNWLLSEEGQAAIASYRVEGRQLFFPNAGG